jgi:uncharacterized membrane protein YeiB
MLLLIALANSHYFLRGETVFGGFPTGGSVLDSVVAWVVSSFVDGRAYPMFGLLFGYGVARIVERHELRGPRGVRRVLWRRALVLIGVGFVHAVLLFVGDILTAYGVLLLVGAWMVRWRDRWLITAAVVVLVLLALPSDDSLSTSTLPPDAAMLPPDLWTMLTARPVVSLFIGLVGPIGFLTPFAIGLWAGRRRILEQPERHLTLLRLTVVLGLGAAVVGAQPVALVAAGVLPAPAAETLSVLGPLHDATGYLGGFGWAAVFCLLAHRLRSPRRRPFLDAVVATGQRSMTCYLAQSVVWTVVFTPFLLDLSDTLTVSTTALLAVVTWLLTVLLADRLRRADRRGPFEVLVRRVSYGSRATASPAQRAGSIVSPFSRPQSQ